MFLDNVKESKNENIINININENKNNINDGINLCFEFEKKYDEFIKGKNNRIDKLKNKYKVFNSKDDKDNNNTDYNTKGFKISKTYELDL
jgi:hypothetical protein